MFRFRFEVEGRSERVPRPTPPLSHKKAKLIAMITLLAALIGLLAAVLRVYVYAVAP